VLRRRSRPVCGRTKTAGEWAVRSIDATSVIVRTAWLYGDHGPNFVKTMLRLAEEREVVSVVSDQTGQPTWTRDLSEFIFRLVGSGVPGGYYHGTNSGEVSRDHLAQIIFKLAGLDPGRVIPCSTGDFPLPACRPKFSVLAHDPGDPPMRPWAEALQHYLELGTGD
jgi:dTDP-4-dehydrorhamnose reductase